MIGRIWHGWTTREKADADESLLNGEIFLGIRDRDRPFSFEQSADDAAALIRHLNIGGADFFGYSNGGGIALQIAIRHPKIVRKLVVASAM